MQSFLLKVKPNDCTKSLYSYISVLHQNADDKHTIANVLSLVHDEFHVGRERQHLVVAGDAKTYNHLQTIKREYGSAMSWLITFIGDWHVLKNAQPVLMKIYFDAGL